MSGSVIGFIGWALVGVAIAAIGISDFFSTKAVGFWANMKPPTVNDIKGYNRAVGKLFIAYGLIFVLLGLPLLSAQNTPYILLSVFGVMIESIVLMAVYNLCIERKYTEK